MLAPTLIGEKVTLQPISIPEILHSRKWARNPRIQRFILADFGNSSDEEQIKFWKKSRHSSADMMFSIHENATGQHIGNCGIHRFDRNSSQAEIGIFIGVENLHSKGLGTEVVHILRDYAFSELKLNRLALEVFSHNPRAIRCYEKSAFKKEGTLRQKIKKGKRFLDADIMSILRSEWKNLTKNGKNLAYKFPKN